MVHDEQEKEALGLRLAAARKAAGFTMAQAAQELTDQGSKIGKGGIGAWEVGRNIPDALWLQKLARLYSISLDALVLNEPTWPFHRVSRDRVLRLDPESLAYVEGRLEAAIEACEGGEVPAKRPASHETVRRREPIDKARAA